MKAGHSHLGLGGGVQLRGRAGLWAAASPSPDSLSERLSQVRGPHPAARVAPNSSSAVGGARGHPEIILPHQCCQASCLGGNIIHKQVLLGFVMDKSCFLVHPLLLA